MMASELDYKILILERSECLSGLEKLRLENLKEQKAFQASARIACIKIVKLPIKWVPQESPVKSSYNKSVEVKDKEAFANAYLQFKKEKKNLLNKGVSGAKLDLKQIRHEWKFLSLIQRKKNTEN